LADEQKKELQKVLMALVEPYRKEDQEEALECLQRQGGLDKCSLAFYREGDIGNDGEWDNWRLEGPSFVWYFRGYPHVHVWVFVAPVGFHDTICHEQDRIAWLQHHRGSGSKLPIGHDPQGHARALEVALKGSRSIQDEPGLVSGTGVNERLLASIQSGEEECSEAAV